MDLLNIVLLQLQPSSLHSGNPSSTTMAPIAIDTTSIPARTRQIIIILLIILGFAIICALLGYCVTTLTKLYRLRRREKERAKKISDVEVCFLVFSFSLELDLTAKRQAKMASEKGRRTPNAPPIPTFPPTAYVSPRERQVRIAVMAGWPVGLIDNVSRHADATPTSHSTCSSCGSPDNKPVSKAEIPRRDREIHQSTSSPNAPASHPSEETDQHDSSIITKPISASIPCSSVDDSAPRGLPLPPIVPKMMSAPPSRYDIVRGPTITMNDRYPLIQSSSKRGAAAPSSGKLRLHTRDAMMNATIQVHKFPAWPFSVPKSEGSVLKTHKDAGGNAAGSLTSLRHAKPQSMLAKHNHLS